MDRMEGEDRNGSMQAAHDSDAEGTESGSDTNTGSAGSIAAAGPLPFGPAGFAKRATRDQA